MVKSSNCKSVGHTASFEEHDEGIEKKLVDKNGFNSRREAKR